MNKRLLVICALSLGLLAAVMRFHALAEPGAPIFDETHYVGAASTLVGLKEHPGMGAWASHPLVGKSPDPNFSHPPLGKYLLGIGLLASDGKIVGARAVTAIAGMLSLVFCFLIGVQVLRSPTLALLATTLVATDPAHIVMSRTAMLDIFLFLFASMAIHATLILRTRVPLGKNDLGLLAYAALCLALCGSIKESAITVAIACAALIGTATTASPRDRLKAVGTLAASTIAFTLLWSIYFGYNGFSFLEWIQYRYLVISSLTSPLANHPYGSNPLMWLLDRTPVWFHWERLDPETVRGIVFLFNPVVSILFLVCAVHLALRWWRTRDDGDVTLIAMFLALYLPLIFMVWGRQGFLHHHALALLPMALVVTRSLNLLLARRRHMTTAAVMVTSISGGWLLPFAMNLAIPAAYYALCVRFIGA